MADNLISRQALIEEVNRLSPHVLCEWDTMGVLAAIGRMKTVDAVPVVRCKDCKHGEVDDPDFPNQYYCHQGCGWNNEDFYCAYGERKDHENNL